MQNIHAGNNNALVDLAVAAQFLPPASSETSEAQSVLVCRFSSSIICELQEELLARLSSHIGGGKQLGRRRWSEFASTSLGEKREKSSLLFFKCILIRPLRLCVFSGFSFMSCRFAARMKMKGSREREREKEGGARLAFPQQMLDIFLLFFSSWCETKWWQ